FPCSQHFKIPPIIFGTSALGNLYTILEDNIKLNIVSNCFRYMPTTPIVFDSAGKYGAGLALEILGKCLQKLNINSENVIISNKLGWLRTPLTAAEPTFEKGVWHGLKNDAIQDISYDGILKCWEQGNNLLGESYKPHMISVHDPDEYIMDAEDDKERKKRFQDVIDAYKALAELKGRSKNIAVGIGAKNWKIIMQICRNVDLDWIMFANSLTIYSHPQELVDFISEMDKKNVTIINSAVFNAGFLIGGSYFNYKLIDRNDKEYTNLFAWRESFFKLCEEYNVNPSHACIRFGMSHPSIASIALNTSNPAHVKKNIEEVQADVPAEFFNIMKQKELINPDYSYV
ncbi:aldo/keto reductase, partial [Bacteroidota bacterium]